MSKGTAIFLDTSIQIARFVHSPELKQMIAARIAQYDLPVSSEVVRHEFKRRLLKEAQYLLNQLNRLGSLAKVLRHIIDHLPAPQARKRNICLEILQTIFEGRDDSDLTERGRSYLRMLLKYGLDDFDGTVKHLVRDAGCACARFGITERKRSRDYDFGEDHCSDVSNACGIVLFLQLRSQVIGRIYEGLRSIPANEKSAELNRAEQFIARFIANPNGAPADDPCLTVGDLIIALESVGFSAFYTMNEKESRYLSRHLDQDLIVRPKYHIHQDRLCPKTDSDWGPILTRDKTNES